jgi:hypothetical protein
MIMTDESRGFWQSGRMLLRFQIKLAADALRDIFLSPVSIVCVLLDFVFGLYGKSSLYFRLMELGEKSDRYINLFGQYSDSQSIDKLVDDVEKKISGKDP